MMHHRVNFGLPSLLDTAFIQPGRRNPYALLELNAHGGNAVEDGALDDNSERTIAGFGRLVDQLQTLRTDFPAA